MSAALPFHVAYALGVGIWCTVAALITIALAWVVRWFANLRHIGPFLDELGDLSKPLPGEVGDDTLRMLRPYTAEETERFIAELYGDLDRGEL